MNYKTKYRALLSSRIAAACFAAAAIAGCSNSEFDVPAILGRPQRLVSWTSTTGDASIWFTANDGIGSVSAPGEVIVRAVVPNDPYNPGGFGGSPPSLPPVVVTLDESWYLFSHAIAVGPDNNLWFTQGTQPEVLTRVDATLAFEDTYSLESPSRLGPLALSMTAGPDGALWFADASNGLLIRQPIDGSPSQEFGIEDDESPAAGIVAGPDGNIWFTRNHLYESRFTVCRLSLASGRIEEFPVVTTTLAGLGGIVAGKDGNLWFTEFSAIGQVIIDGTVDGRPVINQYPLPDPDSEISGIVAAPDGNIYFTEYKTNKIGRISASGIIVEKPNPVGGVGPGNIAFGADGQLWFTEASGKIARMAPFPD